MVHKYNITFFRSHKGVRTMEIVRREIKELEDLMRGTCNCNPFISA